MFTNKKQKPIVLTDVDRMILESWNPIIEMLAGYLGSNYEILLHGLDDLDHSVRRIANGHHSGRKEGSPVTDLALDMLEQYQKNGENANPVYFVKQKNGSPVKASTIPIKGENQRIIGLVCINCYMNIPLCDFIAQFQPLPHTEPFVTETFVDNVEDLIAQMVTQATTEINSDESILPSLKKKFIVAKLYEKGIFKMKNAVNLVAQEMGISKNTVYLHLKNVEL